MTDQNIKIRSASIDDLIVLQSLYKSTIDYTCKNDYSEEQRKVWKSGIKNRKRWTDAIINQYFLIVEIENTIAGFGSLKDGEYIDFLYVSKDYLRKGIANQLFQKLELASKKFKKVATTSDVSIAAKPFFEKKGFQVQKENKIVIDDIELINYRMVKSLKYSN